MPSVTLVDQLIYKLGLDSRDFTKGQKQAAAELLKTEQTVKKSSEGMGRSLLQFTGKLAGITTAVVAVKKAVSYVSELSTTVRQLGIDSRNFGLAANELRNFQNLSEMNGGKAEEATRTIGNLTKAVYDLAYNGQISDSLIMLGRLGVQFQDTAGNARNFNDIVSDTETAIQKLMKSGTSRANANQILAQAGFDPGLTQAILDGKVKSEIALQRARRQVTGEAVDSATMFERSATNRDQAISAATLRVLPASAKAGTFANDKIAAGAEGLSDLDLSGTWDSITDALGDGAKKIKKAADSFVDSVENLAARALRESYPKGRDAYEDQIQRAAKRHGVDPEMLAGVLNTESRFDPAATNKSGAVGIAQLMPKYFPDAGRNPWDDIDTSAAYLKALQDSFLKDGNDLAASQYLALQSYNAGQSRVRKANAGGKPLAQETIDYPQKVLGYAGQAVPTPGAIGGAGGSSTSNEVNIGRIDIHTPAENAEGIAGEIAGATRRKLMAAQADAGMN